jgi:hypothetical protein
MSDLVTDLLSTIYGHYEVHKEATDLRERQRQYAGGVSEAWVEEIFLLPTRATIMTYPLTQTILN